MTSAGEAVASRSGAGEARPLGASWTLGGGGPSASARAYDSGCHRRRWAGWRPARSAAAERRRVGFAALRAGKRFPRGLFGGGQLARITIPCVTQRQSARALPPAVEILVTRIGASSPIRLDKTIQPTPIRDSDSIHTSAQKPESLNIPKLPEIMFPDAPGRLRIEPLRQRCS